MMTFDVGDLTQKIMIYFQHHLKNDIVDMNARLDDLGFESIDYIDLAAFLFETTGQWLDISKISNDTRISNISSCLVTLELEKLQPKTMVKLNSISRYTYSYELQNKPGKDTAYIVRFLCLKEDIDIPKLKLAIEKTLENNYILNSKLIQIIDEYYFEKTSVQSDFTFKGSVFFPKKDLARLIINLQSKVFNIYIQKKNKQHYLIITFHHIALDGWSHTIIEEEIFRRYAGIYKIKEKNDSEAIRALNKTCSSSLNEQSKTDELRVLFESINPYEYNKLGHLFQGKLQTNYSCFVIKKEDIDQYARDKNINNFPYGVILTFMFHQMVSKLSGIDKLNIYTSLSNRHLPISGIKELATNLSTGMPLFLNGTNMVSKQFAAKINEILKVYFKHMSYGAITRILLDNNTLLNKFLSPFNQPCMLGLSYINNPSKIIYGNDSLTSHYINWNKSRTHINIEKINMVFLIVHNKGSEFVIELHSRMTKELHDAMAHDFLEMVQIE